MIYLDNAATSWPKPPEVLKAMTEVMERAGGNPGRSGHRLSIEAARVIYDTREAVARFFGISDPLRVIFASNATHAINLALKGMLKPGDHVITSSMEHNAVMRPLRSLGKQGVRLSIIPCFANGSIDVRDISRAIKPNTKLVVMTHASNVVGTVLPVNEIATIAHQAGTLLLVDAAQTAGVLPIDMRASGIDLLAFTGHKELQGPPGIGGLVINNNVNVSQIEPLICGGTGSRSESEEQPENLPDKFESGTANLVGIAGLGAGLRWIMDKGISEIWDNMKKLRRTLIDGLSALPEVTTYGTTDTDLAAAIVSFQIDSKHVSEIGLILDEEYGILSRVGLHCAPVAHKTIGSFPEGTVRLSPGVFTTVGEVQETLRAIRKIVKS